MKTRVVAIRGASLGRSKAPPLPLSSYVGSVSQRYLRGEI